MTKTRCFRITVGALLWLSATAGLCWQWRAWDLAAKQSAAAQAAPTEVTAALWQFAAGSRQSIELEFSEPAVVAVGDPIFLLQGEGKARQVGEISALPAPYEREAWAQVQTATALFYPTVGHSLHNSRLEYYETPADMNWVIQTMLPEEKRLEIAQVLSAAFAEHHEEIIAALKPIVEDALRAGLLVVQEEFPAALSARRESLQTLAAKYQNDVVVEKVIPLVKEEIFPIARSHAEPLVTQVGQEIWSSASLWRFGWRFAYDKSPLPKKDLVKQEFTRFVEENALPILEEHTDDFVLTTQAILYDVAKNEAVQAAFKSTVQQVVEDEELQHLVWDLLREVVIDNPRLKEVLQQHWQSDRTKAALVLASDRLEPVVRQIGDMLLGTQEAGISPEFALVLRNQILFKDRRWLVLHAGQQSAGANSSLPEMLPVVTGGQVEAYPFVPQ